jgi:hypothetical protein
MTTKDTDDLLILINLIEKQIWFLADLFWNLSPIPLIDKIYRKTDFL